jgi:redox-sensitive bicupin YhaK (pirin superfamily)
MDGAEPTVMRAHDRFHTATDGVSTWHCFSFGDHYDPANVGVGPLVAVNDITLEPGAGFAPHRHQDTEIVTWVVSGVLLHEDSAGGRHLTRPGIVQRLSAGAGVTHSETAPDARETPGQAAESEQAPAAPTRFIQMWVLPDDAGGTASYDTGTVDLEALRSEYTVLAGAHGPAERSPAVTIRREGAVLAAARMRPGDVRTLPGGDLAHLFVVSGTVRLRSCEPLGLGDSATVVGAPAVELRCLAAAEVLLWGLRNPQG